MSASGFVSYVERNDVWIKARVYERYLSAEEPAGAVAQEMERPFDLTACDRVTATLYDGDGNQVGADYRVDAVENNCLVIHPSRDLPSGGYALETLCVKNGVHSRSFRFAIMIVETDRQARTKLCVIDGYRSASLRVTLQIVSQAEVRGRDTIDEWLALPENQGKTREDFVVEVLGLYVRAVSLREAIVIATHPDYVGADNYVYHWQNGAYVKTDIFVKGAKGDAFTYNDFTPEQLAALKGAKGDAFTYNDFTPEQLAALKGAKGDAFTYNDFTPEQLAALKGAKGDAFTYNDFTPEQLAALKGAKGDAFTYNDFTPEQLAALKGGKGDAFTFNDFTPEQLAALKGDPSSADISLVGTVVTVTNNAGEVRSVDVSDLIIHKADKTVVVDGSTLPASLEPNKVYQLGTLTGSVTIPAFASVQSGDTEAKIWCFTFSTSTTAPTITWPAGITGWSGGSAPTINASKSYEVTVMDGIAVLIEA